MMLINAIPSTSFLCTAQSLLALAMPIVCISFVRPWTILCRDISGGIVRAETSGVSGVILFSRKTTGSLLNLIPRRRI